MVFLQHKTRNPQYRPTELGIAWNMRGGAQLTEGAMELVGAEGIGRGARHRGGAGARR